MSEAIQSSSESTSAPTKCFPGGAWTMPFNSDPTRVFDALDAVSHVGSTALLVTLDEEKWYNNQHVYFKLEV
jgi:hypothetical protein